MPCLACPLRLCPSSQKLSSGPEAGSAWSTWEMKRELKSFWKLLCYSTSSWTGQNFASDCFSMVQGYIVRLHQSREGIYTFLTKRAQFLRQRKKLFSVSLRFAKPLSSQGRVSLQRGFPLSSTERFQSFQRELPLWILLVLEMHTFIGAKMANVRNKTKTSRGAGGSSRN